MTEHAVPPDQWHAEERDLVLRKLRVVRLRLQLGIAEIDNIGGLLSANRIAPSGARAWLADILTEGGES